MSAFGTKRTYACAPQMSAFGGKADMTIALHMSAYDPKRTSHGLASSAREHRRLMQKGVVVDLLDDEIRHVGARDEPACPVARID